jgi:nitrous oxidase accessory protein
VITSALCLLAAVLPARVIHVAPGSAVATVGAALERAGRGDTIVVHAGLYHEAGLSITRPVQILGQGAPVIDGGGASVFLVSADSVGIAGLTIRNVAPSFTEDRAAIRVANIRGCSIRDNTIRDSFFAVYAARAEDCVIEGNVIVGSGRTETANGNAIHLYRTRGMIVVRNEVRGHRDGIYLEFGRQATIRGNSSHGNTRYGLHFMYSDSCAYDGNTFRGNRAGVAVMYSRNVAMTGNTFAGATGAAAYGLLLKEIGDSRLEQNTFSGNTVALSLEGGQRVVARRNRFVRNGWAVRLGGDADAGRFEGNEFSGNAFDVVTNSRQAPTRFAGNFWDRYDGYDLDRDGLGDVPFRPVRLFGLIVEQHPEAIILLNSLLVDLLDMSERVAPILTPELPVDSTPLIRRQS